MLERPSGLVRLVDRLSRRGSLTRRGLLRRGRRGRVGPRDEPARRTRCSRRRPTRPSAGPGNTASSGWTIFCATINKGVNACPPGSFTAGWWKAADSSWCGGGYRYIVDCNAKCTKCTSGCSDHICDSKCWNCSCSTGSTRHVRPAPQLLQRLPLRPVQHPGEVQRWRALPGRVVRRPLQVGELLDDLVPQRLHGRAQLAVPAAVGADGEALHRDGWAQVLPQGLDRPDPRHHRRHREVRQLPGRTDLVDERARGRPR